MRKSEYDFGIQQNKCFKVNYHISDRENIAGQCKILHFPFSNVYRISNA